MFYSLCWNTDGAIVLHPDGAVVLHPDGAVQVTARIDFNSEGGQRVIFHSAVRIKNDFNTDLKASTDPASLIRLGRLFHRNGARQTRIDVLFLCVSQVRPAAADAVRGAGRGDDRGLRSHLPGAVPGHPAGDGPEERVRW